MERWPTPLSNQNQALQALGSVTAVVLDVHLGGDQHAVAAIAALGDLDFHIDPVGQDHFWVETCQ